MTVTRGTFLSAVTILAFLILAAISMVWLVAVQRALQQELAESNLWAASQAERESLRFSLLLRSAEAAAEDRALQFEILFSRIDLLATNPQRAYFATIGQGAAVDRAMALLRSLDAAPVTEPDPDSARLAAELAEVSRGIAIATYLAERRTRFMLHDREHRATNLLTASVIGAVLAGLAMATLLIRRTRGLLRVRTELEAHQRQLERTIADRTVKLREALGAERRAKEVYRSFVVTVAHQFRTSLSIIHMTAQRQVRRPEGQIDAEMRLRFSKIVDAAERLERLIGGFLETAAFQKRDIEGKRSRVDFNAIASVAVAQTRATQPDRKIDCDFAADPLLLDGDAVLLEQVVLILLSNALKYSAPTGPVQVTTWKDGTLVRCSITDVGCGIPEEAMGAIFEPYYRAPNAHRFPGVGVGLSLAAQFVDLHGGRIDVTSTLGEGTTFSVCLQGWGSNPA
ncbi:sensor histidine kinase [Pararhodobacter aggregans]|uniref:histidine kinase n=1 Tax=Pararhodobacter aggregans TaxID=404875 RepID=A0A2T7UMK8_9RHOB|nr:HAMP domain-containing sensor histidine kinase [Pararhodobacter aggregans]PTW99147.1 histidine kinase/DNA gyrase B/HSP90-like ATPase [Pararhodobacter aggregans]PVE45868.1 sensor histidine kinase [Pararhodobacter aggregans]